MIFITWDEQYFFQSLILLDKKLKIRQTKSYENKVLKLLKYQE